jgi:hypothetical protein
MNAHEFKRPLKYSIKPSPTRLFLREALELVSQDPTNKMLSSICVMGIVSTEPRQQDVHSDYSTFVIDDGTASVNVLYASNLITSIEIPAGMPHLKSLVLGDEIECVGAMTTHQGIHTNQYEHDSKTETSFTFLLKSFALVEDRNLSSLRTIELSQNQRNHHVGSQLDSTAFVHMYGDVMKKLQPVTDTDDGRISLYRRYLFRLIQLSKSENGITEQDIALLLGLKSEEERVALKVTLEEMQSNCEIYQSKSFSYLPL